MLMAFSISPAEHVDGMQRPMLKVEPSRKASTSIISSTSVAGMPKVELS